MSKNKKGKSLTITAIILLCLILCALAALIYLCREPGTDTLEYVKTNILPLMIKGVAVAGTVVAALAPSIAKINRGSSALQLTTLENGRLEENVQKNAQLFEAMKEENRADREAMRDELNRSLSLMEKEMREERESFREEYRTLFSKISQGVEVGAGSSLRTEEMVKLIGTNTKEMVAKGVSGQIAAIEQNKTVTSEQNKQVKDGGMSDGG